ncbi:hypothetical protein BSZ35_06295 [Salinibacter sp. 10B]|uniref:hypothetical protein n=1 Tax=Salinibacter sp. 10B TaxID=1923971 RepID=UPI000CF4C002|nr:hypothetical protein [Salinibacter sp. 10B]PQJ34258.1 hypothetical protein BSZ35_06295 [Salinibacter sp. 10B]
MVLALPFQEASAQRWLQTSQLFVNELESNSPPRVLLDTLTQVLKRSDSLKVSRKPDGEEYEISELRDQLINGPGIGLTSANGIFIDYRFEIRNRGFEESIESFRFIYRPTGGTGEDIEMLYVDASETWVKNILRNKGTTLTTNQAALKTFSDQLSFARMAKSGQVVEIAGETVREGFETEKRQLVQKIQRLTYESM